jgi:secreted trypsin-like serine protease
MVMASSTQLLNQQHSDVEINTNDTAKKDLRIIGGMEATEDRYMYTVSFLDGNNFAFCGGSLILKDVVLTAAHCLDGGKDFQVAVGRYDLTDKDGERISVKQTIIHPFYKTRGDHNYDFALVILSSPVQDDNIQLIKLNNDNAHPNQGSIAHVMGWGDTDPGSAVVTVTVLQIVSVEVISNEECETITINGQNYQGMIDESMLCTFAEGQDACQGDSGEFRRDLHHHCSCV